MLLSVAVGIRLMSLLRCNQMRKPSMPEGLKGMKMGNELVSIIMLSHGDSTHIVETVKSILAQTYQNWELLFVAKTDDESLKPFSLLREEYIKIQKMAGKVLTDSYSKP